MNNGHCPGGGCPPALALMQDTSVPPHMSLVLFKVLPQYWSPEGVSLSKFVHWALQEEMADNPSVSSTDPNPIGFYSQKFWELTFLALEPWAGWSGVGLGSLKPTRYPSILYPAHVDLGPAHSMSPCLCPSYLSGQICFP